MLLSFLLHKKTLLVEAIMLLDSLTIIRNALNPLDFGLNLIAKPEPDWSIFINSPEDKLDPTVW